MQRNGQELAGIQDRFTLEQRCLSEGICVNGCGPLTVHSTTHRQCPVCKVDFYSYGHKQPVEWDAPDYSQGQPDYEL
jgi:hypothetical protein